MIYGKRSTTAFPLPGVDLTAVLKLRRRGWGNLVVIRCLGLDMDRINVQSLKLFGQQRACWLSRVDVNDI